jgi:hypothetical protein
MLAFKPDMRRPADIHMNLPCYHRHALDEDDLGPGCCCCRPAGQAPGLPPEMHDMNPLYAATKRHMSPQVSLGPRPPSSGWQVGGTLCTTSP